MNLKEVRNLQALLSKSPQPTDDEAFRKIMKHVGRDIPVKAFADKFGVNRSTVGRWISGESVPHAVARPRIYTWLRSQANALLKAAKAAAPSESPSTPPEACEPLAARAWE